MYDWILLGQIEYQERLQRAQSRRHQHQSGWRVKPVSKSGHRLRNAAKALFRRLKHSLTQTRAQSEERVSEQAQPSIG